MSLFQNQGAAKSGLFSGGTGGGIGSGTGSGGGLFANKPTTGTGTGTTGGSLFSGGTGTGTTTGGGGGGLFSGGSGGSVLGGGATGTFSLNAPNMNPQHEAEFNNVLERFAQSLE